VIINNKKSLIKDIKERKDYSLPVLWQIFSYVLPELFKEGI
jgi:hypothetical protein